MRELQQMGVLTTETIPQLIGPFRTITEAFAGDTSGNTETLAQTPVGSLMFLAGWTTVESAANTPVVMTENTHYTISGVTITWITDQSAVDFLCHYAY